MTQTTRPLMDTLPKLRERIQQIRDRNERIGEQNTKAVLIDPLLSALGWHLEDLDEVSREYKRKPQDNPVDYALFLLRSPCLFIEAKALGEDLGDRKWVSQILGYATVVGVEWCVLTNGDEYRIYNSHATVEVEEKLFRAVRISDSAQDEYTLDTLELLSKDKMGDNRINVLWKAHFIDRNVKTALDDLFQNEDSSLIRLIRKKTPELKPSEIRESLKRANIRIDFPMIPASVPSPTKRKPEVEVPERHILRHRFWAELLERAKEKTKLHAANSPTRYDFVGTSAGKRGLGFYYSIRQHEANVELYIDRGKEAKDENKKIFDILEKSKDAIEADFGGPLEWQRLESKRGCRIRKQIKLGGYRDEEDKWPEIQDAMIDAMIRLERALKPHIEKLQM